MFDVWLFNLPNVMGTLSLICTVFYQKAIKIYALNIRLEFDKELLKLNKYMKNILRMKQGMTDSCRIWKTMLDAHLIGALYGKNKERKWLKS